MVFIKPNVINNSIFCYKRFFSLFVFIFFFNSTAYSFEEVEVNNIQDLADLYTEMHASCIMQSFSDKKDNDQACYVAESILNDEKMDGANQFYIAMHLLSGEDENIGADYFLSKVWMEKAANNKNNSARQGLALMYLEGKGVKQNIGKAIYWLEMTAKNGDQNGNLLLGKMFSDGTLVEKDLKKSKYYYGLMCDSGEQLGCELYKSVNEELLLNN